jgi:hypothetical protein
MSLNFNPHKLEAPTDFFLRIQDFARDLAYGVMNGAWRNGFFMDQMSGPPDDAGSFNKYGPIMWWSLSSKQPISIYLENKWKMQEPTIDLLKTMHYIDSSNLLTEKAFDLLIAPQIPSKIFISYRRNESTALALLFEARLKVLGNLNPFVDKNMETGEDWEERVKHAIQTCTDVIAIIGPTTLESPNVMNEISWAQEFDRRIHPVFYKTDIPKNAPDILTGKNGVFIRSEDPFDYEQQIARILNSLGYPTY